MFAGATLALVDGGQAAPLPHRVKRWKAVVVATLCLAAVIALGVGVRHYTLRSGLIIPANSYVGPGGQRTNAGDYSLGRGDFPTDRNFRTIPASARDTRVDLPPGVYTVFGGCTGFTVVVHAHHFSRPTKFFGTTCPPE
jgi:hypothetical protein